MQNMAQRIEERLQTAFAPNLLEIIDESAEHAGHAGARPGGQTHYFVKITSLRFQGLSRIQSHRAIYKALAAELADGVHALRIDARAP